MTENHKLWLKELIEEYRVAASNESIWAKGAPDAETAQMHEDNSEELTAFANLLDTLFH